MCVCVCVHVSYNEYQQASYDFSLLSFWFMVIFGHERIRRGRGREGGGEGRGRNGEGKVLLLLHNMLVLHTCMNSCLCL